jgi:hypothetical protein
MMKATVFATSIISAATVFKYAPIGVLAALVVAVIVVILGETCADIYIRIRRSHREKDP